MMLANKKIIGIKLFEDDERDKAVASIMVLTDGMPNHMYVNAYQLYEGKLTTTNRCPVQGYVPKLRQYDLPATINTFGFGYSIKSGLLKSIAEVSGGNYAFIPDAGMIVSRKGKSYEAAWTNGSIQGTVFVHAIANLQSTYATEACLTVIGSSNLTLAETTGEYVRKEKYDSSIVDESHRFQQNLKIPLGNLQYGQSRDILLEYGQDFDLASEVSVHLEFDLIDGIKSAISAVQGINQTTTVLSPSEIAYHISRARICTFLSSLAPLKNEQHQQLPAKELPAKRAELETLINTIASVEYSDEYNQSLLTDLGGADPAGQISLAISTDTFYNRWGKHYLPSLHNAYAKQICNSFKDAGPLQFGKHSPLFMQCRDRLDLAFDSLPAPKPSVVVKDATGNPVKKSVVMSHYHRASNPCFAGDCAIRLSDENSSVILSDLKPGTSLWTPAGSRKVVHIVRTSVRKQEMCVIGKCKVTPHHPIYVNGNWAFPQDIKEKRMLYTGMIYSLLLEKDKNVDAHAVEVGGVLAVTLGHGLTDMDAVGDVRAHTFLGSYGQVVENLAKLPVGLDGVSVSRGMTRDNKSGLVSGFLGTTDEKIGQMGIQAIETNNRIAVECT
jgi:hypothetical protein